MLYKAVKVIKTKAPSKNKPQVALMTTAGAIKVRATLLATTVPRLVFWNGFVYWNVKNAYLFLQVVANCFLFQDGRMYPAALIGKGYDGRTMIKLPLLTIISIGHTGKSFVYVTVEPHTVRLILLFRACPRTAHVADTTRTKSPLFPSAFNVKRSAIKVPHERLRIQQSPGARANLGITRFRPNQCYNFVRVRFAVLCCRLMSRVPADGEDAVLDPRLLV
jgi:hypothetical protein